MEIERRLSNFPVPDDVQHQWETDLKINARGVAVDMSLVQGALDIANQSRNELMQEAIDLTELENPNSVSQLSKWLETETNSSFNDLRKDTVSRILAQKLVSGKAERILQIRQELGKTSTKKYDAIETAVCADNRIRGLIQFYGANRTGRYAGRLVQVQNLPRTYINIDLLPLARDLVKKHEGEKLSLLFGSINNTLSQLIRTAFVAAQNKILVDADFSSIEARIVAWLAKEEWKIKAFNQHKDIYCETASAMFNVPVEKHGINSALRTKGKIAELACVAEGELVLTNKGLVPIEKITLDHKLWDGEEWVSHDGVIFKGEREVIEYDGLKATANHFVWIEGQSEPIYFGIAATCGARLLQTGNGRATIRLGKNHKLRKTLEPDMESLLCIDAMYRLWSNTMAKSWKFTKRKIQRLSTMLKTPSDSYLVRQKINYRETTLRKSKKQRISQLRRERNKILFPFNFSGRIVDYRKSWFAGSCYGIRPHKQQRPLRSRQFEVRNSNTKQPQQAYYSTNEIQSSGMALLLQCSNTEIVARNDTGGNYTRRGKSGSGEEKKLARHCGKIKVYDIRNAGKRHCFTVSGKLVHNCGYGGGVGALKAMGALDMGIPEEDLQDIVTKWRQANPNIVRLWYAVENAVISVIRDGKTKGVNGLIFSREIDTQNNLDFMTIQLPSKRKLYYVEPSLDTDGIKQVIAYKGVNQTTKQWTDILTYGAKIVENIVQAIARDCLAITIERLEESGYPLVFHIHDEVVIECDKDKADLNQVIAIMTNPISWAKDLPLNADGWIGDFFRKD